MMSGEAAQFDEEQGIWIEYTVCDYGCYRDGKALQEADELDLEAFHRTHPQMQCKESFYDLEYGKTGDDVLSVFWILTEYENGKCRTFSFGMDHTTMQEFRSCQEAVEAWHRTGNLDLQGIPVTFSATDRKGKNR
jgi:hypothetical protein